MTLEIAELQVLQAAEAVADDVWRQIVEWEPFAREVVGQQLARAGDAVGANVAASFGRVYYGEKLQFLYYAHSSILETKYWLNRACKRDLMPSAQVQDYASQLYKLACQLNDLAAGLKMQSQASRSQPKIIREAAIKYATGESNDIPAPLFGDQELTWLQAIPTGDTSG